MDSKFNDYLQTHIIIQRKYDLLIAFYSGLIEPREERSTTKQQASKVYIITPPAVGEAES